MHRIVDLALDNRLLVLVLTLLLVATGTYAMLRLPIDAVPDVTPNQVQIISKAPGLGPLEVERSVTFPVETAMGGLPGVRDIRSVSRYGISVVSLYFDEEVDTYFARQLVLERLPHAQEAIPAGFGAPEMGPISTGLGEIYQFEVRGDGHSPMELRSILDWEIAPKLRTVPGVIEVNTFGGELKTYEVQIEPDRLYSHGLSLESVFEALQRNNANAGGGYIQRNHEQVLIRGEGLIENLDDIENIVVAAGEDGTPVYIRNIGRAEYAPMLRQGAVTRDGRGEAVTGIAMMLIGENSRTVAERVGEKIEEIRDYLPAGVRIDTYYDRTDLVKRTIATVTANLSEGGLLVVIVLLVLLGSIRGGLMVALAIPLSMLFAFILMLRFKISGNLMSLGAIDFGLIVDGSVVMIENIMRRLSGGQNRGNLLEGVREAAREVVRPIIAAVGIIIIVYLPVLTLEGVEGKMFRPMAWTVVFALAGGLILSLTLMPVLASFGLAGAQKPGDPRVLRWLKKAYEPMLRAVLARPVLTGGAAMLVFLLSLTVVPFMGAEFIPELDEGTIAIQAWRLPSVSLEESIKATTRIEQELKAFPEVVTVVSRTGSAEIATDPHGADISDIYVILKPRREWRSAATKTELISLMESRLHKTVPGNIYSFSQPIELRLQELAAGVRSDVAVQVFGDDLDELRRLADEIARELARVRGAFDVKAEQVAGTPYMRLRVKRQEIARYGINASQILDAVEAVGGRTVGQVLEGQRRYDLRVRFAEGKRSDLDSILNIRVADARGRQIPISQLAEVSVEEGPAQISRQNAQRKIAVEANVRGRDLAGFVADARNALRNNIRLPAGYRIEWGGQFENLDRATRRLAIVIPVALFLIYFILQTTFRSAKIAAMIYLNVPVAATGGILALTLRGMPFSVSAGVGFIALFGVAVLNGVVLLSYMNQLRQRGRTYLEAAYEGAMTRLRPVLMTALVASLGFVPMALSTSPGAEVQRPLATVVIGGLITSTILTLLVLPAIYGREKD